MKFSATVTLKVDPPPELVEKYKQKYQAVAEQFKTLGIAVRDGASELLSNEEISSCLSAGYVEAQKIMISKMKGFSPCEPLAGKNANGHSTGLNFSISGNVYGSMRDGFYFWYQMRFEQ